MTIATIALGIFTALLWRATKRAVTDTAEAIGIGRKANEIAERSIVEQNRPWVFVSKIALQPERSAIRIVIRNSGIAPARNVQKAASGHVLPHPFPSSNLPVPEPGSGTFLPPKSIEIIEVPAPSQMPNGNEYRIRIFISYVLQDERTEVFHMDFAMRMDGRIRKVTANDYAAYQGKDTYTFDL